MNHKRRHEFDRIRLNLQQFDMLTSTKPLVDRLFSNAPILPFAISFAVGIFISYEVQTGRIPWIAMSCLSLSAGLCLLIRRRKTKLQLALSVCICCLAALSLGSARAYFITDAPPHHITHCLNNERELATLTGKIISPVKTDNSSRGLSAIPWLSAQSSFYLQTEQIQLTNGWQKATGTIRVQVSETINHLQPGNTVRIDCWLSRFTAPSNPGQFDLRKHMHQRGVYLAASVPVADGIEVIDPSASLLPKTRSMFHRLASEALLDETAIDTTVRSLTAALLLGRRSSLNPQIMAAFRETNLAHFISLSGMHVGILAASLWWILRLPGLQKRPRALLCIILILIYAMIVPARAPTMRAVFISCFFFASVVFRRQVSALNTLSLSALVLLFIHPYSLFEAGWQLSFLSVLGILLFFPSVQYHFLARLYYPVIIYLPKSLSFLKSFLRYLLEGLAVGVSVWIAIAPILLYYFGRINPLSPLWTVLVLPFVWVILYAGFAKILLSSLLPTLASVLGLILNYASIGFENAVIALSKIDFIQVVSYRPAFYLVLLIYALMLAVFVIPPCHQRVRKGVICLTLLCFFYPGLSSHLDTTGTGGLEVTCLSVGHGQAIVLSTPGNEHLLFDAGSITNRNIAYKTILPFLQHKSIFSLDAACLSHSDMDHVNAISDIAASVEIETIYANRVFLESAQKASFENQVCSTLGQMGKTINPFQDYNGHDGVTIQSLWPNESILARPLISENDKSEVLLITYADRNILLCGDIERTAQQQLMNSQPELSVDVIILPHHGSTNNLDTRFVEHFGPSVTIASCSKRWVKNAYRPPEQSKIQAFYTPIDGAITIKIKPDGSMNVDHFLTEGQK